jgi:hypothetical protein
VLDGRIGDEAILLQGTRGRHEEVVLTLGRQ